MAEINSINNSMNPASLGVQRSSEKIASGQRINRAGDDAAGLAVAEKIGAQARGLRQVERNIQDTISFTQVADGHLSQMQTMSQRIRQLSVQASNGIYSSEDRAMMQAEVDQLNDEINRVGNTAEFNQQPIFSGDFAAQNQPLQVQIGPNQNQQETIAVEEMNASTLGTDQVSLATAESANTAIGQVDQAMARISNQRSDLGAAQNRLETAARGTAVAFENTLASESRVRDSDIAEEMAQLNTNEIKQQASISMAVHRNLDSQLVLKLLQ